MTHRVTGRHSVSSQRVDVHDVDARHLRPRQSGATLVEVSIYLAVVAIITAPIATLALGSTRATADATTFARVMERNRASLIRIGEDLQFAIGTSVWIDSNGKTVGFYLPGNFNGSGAPGGDYIYYTLTDTYEDWENGQDDNNNGLVDEKMLWRFANGTWVPIASSLHYETSGFEFNGSGVGVTMTSVGHSRADGSIQESSSTLVFHPKN